MPNPLLQQRKPTNPQSVLWVIFTILLAVCIWILFERLSPVSQNQFETVEETSETQEQTEETPDGTRGPTGITNTSRADDTSDIERSLDSLNEDADFNF